MKEIVGFSPLKKKKKNTIFSPFSHSDLVIQPVRTGSNALWSFLPSVVLWFQEEGMLNKQKL